MLSEIQAEHRWFESFVGSWSVDSECIMGPDQPPMKSTGKLTGRTLSGFWLLMESVSQTPDGNPWSSLMTIGYDSQRKKFLGSFVASMMTHQWVYEGSLDAAGKKLVLDTTGPRFDETGDARYQDILEKVSDDHWILTSQMLDRDGSWKHFMTAHHRRVK